MKSLKRAGDVNLRGKKLKLMRCRCCYCKDFRDKYNEKIEMQIAKREIDEHSNRTAIL
jgi:hypothetical protein